MNTSIRELVAFHLAGRTAKDSSAQSAGPNLWPALMRRYRDLSTIRHDWPVVLVEKGPGAGVESLSHLVNGFLKREALPDLAGERLRRQVLRLEMEIRSLLFQKQKGSLSQLWQVAAANLAAQPHVTEEEKQSLAANLQRARKALAVDGELIGCKEDAADQVARHLWRRHTQARNRRVQEQLRELRVRLAHVLESDRMKSGTACQPGPLQASFAGRFEEMIDFTAMSRTLLECRQHEPMPAERRERIEWALSVLENESFFGAAPDGNRYGFEFQSCTESIAEFKRRLPEMATLVKAIRLAALELENRYRADAHKSLIECFDASSLTAEDIQWFPHWLVSINERDCDPANQAALLELLASDLPIKVILQSSSLFRDRATDEGALGAVTSRSQLALMAMGLNHPFVLQTTSSNLSQMAESIARGLASPGPALFSFFSPSEDCYPGIPPYLVAAAALESRAFPALVFDPGKGESWASSFTLEGNPAPDLAWTAHSFAYETEAMQPVTETLAFTVIDFLALDPKFTDSFLQISRNQWNDCMVPIEEYLDTDDLTNLERLPFILMVSPDDRLHRVVVKSAALPIARRCARVWQSLQELGGINNSHAQRALEQERRDWEAEKRKLSEEVNGPAASQNGPPPGHHAPAADAETHLQNRQDESAPAVSPDEAYIETARCSSCNECTNRNNRMFKYNENKQAFIADLRAGTYRQLVESAEACKLAIIHTGKPWDPNEPGLDDLLRRAEPFRHGSTAAP
jgi:hypothetical protein